MMLVFFSVGGIHFFKAAEDPWYRATVEEGKVYYFENEMVQLYQPEKASSPLGCVQQYQFCSPPLPADRRCGPLASFVDSIVGSAALFNLTQEVFLSPDFPIHQAGSSFAWLSRLLGSATTDPPYIISSLGARALASQQYLRNGVMGEILGNQWQLDVAHWFST